MDKVSISLPKLRRKIQTNLVLCEGCIFFEENNVCDIPLSYGLDKRFDCAVYNSKTDQITNFIFIKEEK